MSNELEKDVNDEVYEDSFYDNEEELNEEESTEEGTVALADGEVRVTMSFACEECDYRWDDVIVRLEDEDDDVITACPMCGSQNVSQI